MCTDVLTLNTSFVKSKTHTIGYNITTEFVIDLDTIWEWLGFSKKYHAKFT